MEEVVSDMMVGEQFEVAHCTAQEKKFLQGEKEAAWLAAESQPKAGVSSYCFDRALASTFC